MSDTPSRRLPAGGALLTVLAVVVFYVLTWPLVEIQCIHMNAPAAGSAAVPGFVPRRPPWLVALYSPLHAVAKYNHGRNFLVRYRDWWYIVLDTPV